MKVALGEIIFYNRTWRLASLLAYLDLISRLIYTFFGGSGSAIIVHLLAAGGLAPLGTSGLGPISSLGPPPLAPATGGGGAPLGGPRSSAEDIKSELRKAGRAKE